MNLGLSTCFCVGLLSSLAVFTDATAEIVVGDRSVGCAEDPCPEDLDDAEKIARGCPIVASTRVYEIRK